MASLALTQTRPLFRTPAMKFSIANLLPAAFLAPKPITWAIPSLQSLLELFPPFLLAVPKKKTSHSRKSMRSANKGLKDKHNIVHCPGCGSPKLAHHLCSNCYSGLSRGWKSKAKDGQDGTPSIDS
ncbi:ribosomal L32p protein family-domain-containing protein [Cristinia sonorae]|uniref:Large ribosomal subunit protein bL32m n=1 Tax=Cristinia sonorae TaxID=1940300 RepID=A0A8K0XRJ0_9AGAR|nr:ribosomal L32p protein family-domain-containing protein [Cristinia sonorae]